MGSYNKKDYIEFLKQYIIFLIPVVLLLLYALFGRGESSLGYALQLIGVFIVTYWAEILFVTLFIAVAILVLMRIYSRIVIMQLQKKHKEKREKSTIHRMRLGMRRE